MRLRHTLIMLVAVVSMVLTAPGARADALVPLGHVEIRGDGPIPMVLISGPTLDWRYWEAFMDRNGDAYTMYAVTLPGMSGSPAMVQPPLWRPADREKLNQPPLETPWLDNAVEAIADMMIEHETGRAVVMGHAMGGLLAIRMGIEHPQLVSSVISLEGPVAFPTPMQLDKIERAKDALWSFDQNMRSISDAQWPVMMKQWTETGASDPEIVDFVTELSLDTDQDVAVRYMVEHRMTDLTPEISELRVPTLAIFSKVVHERMKQVDGVKKRQFAPAWHEDVRFYDVEDISYFYTLKEPERFDKEISEYLKAQNITGGNVN